MILLRVLKARTTRTASKAIVRLLHNPFDKDYPIPERHKEKKRRPNDYDIILLIRITRCKKNGKRKEGATGQKESHGMDRKIKNQEEIYKRTFGTSKLRTTLHMKHPPRQRIRKRPRTTYPYQRLFILLLLLSRYQRHILLPPPSPRK